MLSSRDAVYLSQMIAPFLAMHREKLALASIYKGPAMHVAGGLEPRADSFFPTLPLLSTLFTRASAAPEGPLFGRLSASAAEAPSTPAREASWSGDGGDLGAPLEPFEEEAGSEVRSWRM